MEERKIYEDIACRTDGDIYIGVVGPVRTGKSTFIKRVMESLVIPNIDNVYRRERARDELPQSGSGRTIMTAEPKFVPEEAVTVSMDASAAFQVRLIDCVGYMVPGAVGQLEGEIERMVTTPWFDHEIPMSEAAEVGTRKVIAEHSTIGIVVTTDGTITEIPREDYLEAEERVIRELKELGKPFVVVAMGQMEGLRVALDLTEQWNALGGDSQLITAVLLVRSEFLDQHPQAVDQFMKEYAASAAFVNDQPAEAAVLVEKYGIVKAAVAEKAIPACNIVCLLGDEMKTAASGYLQVLFDQNPESVGGKLPGDDFYWMGN